MKKKLFPNSCKALVLIALYCFIGGKVMAQTPPTVTINVTPLPVITFNTSIIACEGASYSLTELQALAIASISQSAPIDAVIIGTDTNSSGAITGILSSYTIPIYSKNAAHKDTLFAQAIGGTNNCNGEVQFFVIDILETPKGSISIASGTQCNGQTTTFTFNKTSAGNIASYTWSMKSGSVATATFNTASSNPTDVTWTNVGTGVVQVILTGANQCSTMVETAANVINVQEVPVLANITPTTAVCSGTNVQYATSNTNTNISEGNMAYAWTVTPISNVEPITVPSVTATADIALTQTAVPAIGTAGTTGTATIQVTGTANGCSVSKTVDITVNPIPIAQLFVDNNSDSKTVCNITGGQTLRFTVNTGNGLETSGDSEPYQVTYNKVIGSSTSSATTSGTGNTEKTWTFDDTISSTNETTIKYIVTQVTNGVCTRTYTVTP